MRRVSRHAVLALALPCVVGAQQQAAGRSPLRDTVHKYPLSQRTDFVVKTVPLRHLSSSEAMKLLSPYVQSVGAGVYDVSPNIRAVTIRETSKIYADMIAVLEQYDRDPATVTLNFQLVAGENTATRDPAVAGLDSLLRGVLRFTGYRLLSSSVATASELGNVSQVMSADADSYWLNVMVSDVRVDGSNASVHLNVELSRRALGGRMTTSGQTVPVGTQVLSTGVTVPVGQTVVLGTTAMERSQKALILTVRPQIAAKR